MTEVVIGAILAALVGSGVGLGRRYLRNRDERRVDAAEADKSEVSVDRERIEAVKAEQELHQQSQTSTIETILTTVEQLRAAYEAELAFAKGRVARLEKALTDLMDFLTAPETIAGLAEAGIVIPTAVLLTAAGIRTDPTDEAESIL